MLQYHTSLKTSLLPWIVSLILGVGTTVIQMTHLILITLYFPVKNDPFCVSCHWRILYFAVDLDLNLD